MNHSDLITRISEAVSYSIAAAIGYSADENGRTRILNLYDTRRKSSEATKILNEVLEELQSAGAETNNS
jgi:hypothetical protein